MTDYEISDLKIVHNEPLKRWEAHIDHRMAVAEYELSGNTIVFHHTAVPPELQGRGIAGRLVQAALDDARARQLEVIPLCSFVATFIRRHSAYKALVPDDYRHLLL